MNDDMLLLYYYNDGLSGAERRAVTEALAADAALAARYAALTAELEPLRIAAPPPLAADLRHRLHATIDRAAGAERSVGTAPRSPLHLLSFLLGTAITAALVLGVGIGLWLAAGQGRDTAQPLVVDAGPLAQTGTGAFERGLRVYFRDSKAGLAGIPADDPDRRSAFVSSLIAENRLYAELADRNDAPQLARVLRAFDPILQKLAADDISPEEAAALRDKLEFEINVMLTRLLHESSKTQDPIEQEI